MRQKFDAIINEVIWRESSTGFTAFRAKSGVSVFMCIADMARADEGTSVTLDGVFARDHRFGYVFDCEAAVSEMDKILIKAGISATKRSEILDAHDENRLNLFDMGIPYDLADNLARELGGGAENRIMAAVRQIMSSPRAVRGLPESVITGAVAKACDVDLIEAQFAVRSLIASKFIAITSGGVIVTSDSDLLAGEICAAVAKKINQRSIMSDIQWQSVIEEGILPSDLSAAELAALRMIMMNPIVIISSRDRGLESRIVEAIEIIMTFHPNADHQVDVYSYFTDEDPKDIAEILKSPNAIVIIGDPLSETTWAPYVRAMIAPRLIPHIEVMPRIETLIDAALESVSKTKNLPATCVISEGIVRHTRPDRSEAVTLLEEPDQLAAAEWLVGEARQSGPVDSIIVCATSGGILGVEELGEALRSASVSGAPVAGTFFHGDRIIHPSLGLCLVSGIDHIEPIDGRREVKDQENRSWKTAWAIGIDSVRALDARVKRVYVSVPDGHRWTWLEVYHVLCLASEEIVFVGSRTALRKMMQNPRIPQGRVEAVVDRLDDLKKQRTEIAS